METMQGRGRDVRSLIVAILATALLCAASALAAEEVTREAYKASVEPICKANAEANKNILGGVRAKVKAGKLKPAGRQFIKAAAALRKTLGLIKAKPEPAADEERLSEWQQRISELASRLQQIGKALLEENHHKAQVLSIHLVVDANLTNSIVVGFGFHYCRLEPSKYTS